MSAASGCTATTKPVAPGSPGKDHPRRQVAALHRPPGSPGKGQIRRPGGEEGARTGPTT